MDSELKNYHPNSSFTWIGMNNKGGRVKGELSGHNVLIVQEELRQQGIELIQIKKKSKLSLLFARQIKNSDIVLFSRQIATLLTAEIPLTESLDIIAKSQIKTSAQKLILAIKKDITSGQSFYASLSKYPHFFNEIFINMIRVGEQSGTLNVMLNRLADYMEKSASLKQKITKAMYYPITIVTVSFILGLLLLIFIVPKFETLFMSFEAKLPFFTLFVINVSRFLQEKGLFILVTFSIVILLSKYTLKRSDRFKRIIDAYTLKLPVIGSLIKNSIIARFTRTLSTTLSAGVPLLEGLHSASKVVNNQFFKTVMLQVIESISMGFSIHAALNKAQIFPNLAIQMLAVGEQSGRLENILDKLATLYEEQVHNSVNSISTLIEPIIMIFLGVIIGSFVLAIYLPIFQLGSII